MTTIVASRRPASSMPWLIIICGCLIAGLKERPVERALQPAPAQ